MFKNNKIVKKIFSAKNNPVFRDIWVEKKLKELKKQQDLGCWVWSLKL